MVNFKRETLEAIAWLSANFAAIKTMLGNFGRVQKKIDGFSVTGAAKWSNAPDSMSLAIADGGARDRSSQVVKFRPVLVTQVGGVAGTNKTVNCTFTYDIYDAIADTAKANKLNATGGAIAVTGKGNGWRALRLALTAGANGIAYQLGDGTWKLIFVDEYPAGEQDCA